MRYSRPGESIFAKAKKDPALWTIFAQTMNFHSGEEYFRPGKIGLAQAKEKKIDFLFSII